MNIKDSSLYKHLKPQIRRQDHKELLRMLQMVADTGIEFKGHRLSLAFVWHRSPQGYRYWRELYRRLGGWDSGN